MLGVLRLTPNFFNGVMEIKMEAKKIWGIIMIILGVIFLLMGITGAIGLQSQAAQLESVGNMMGSLGGKLGKNMMGNANDMITNGYIKTGIMCVIGVALSFFGTKFLKQANPKVESQA